MKDAVRAMKMVGESKQQRKARIAKDEEEEVAQ